MTIPTMPACTTSPPKCVTLAGRQFGRYLDWSLASLDEPGAVCGGLPADGPLTARRLDLRQKLTGAHTAEVLVRAYSGQQVTHEQVPGWFAVPVSG